MLHYLKRIRFIHIFWVLFYGLIFTLLLKNAFAGLDPDLGWHLRVGRDIAQTGQVAQANIYNFSYTGEWVDHEWLVNLLIYEIYSRFGYSTLVFISVLPILIIFILLNIFGRRIILAVAGRSAVAEIIIISGLQLIGLTVCLQYFGVRIQELAPLFLLLELILIKAYEQQKKLGYLMVLTLIIFLWANCHGSFLLGLAIFLAWFLFKVGAKIFSNLAINGWLAKDDNITSEKLKHIFIIVVLSFMVTLLTPYRLELYAFLAGYKNTIYLSYIQEWRSQFDWPLNWAQLSYSAVIMCLSLYYAYLTFVKKILKINIWLIFLFVLFLLLSLKSRRHLPLFFVASFELAVLTLTVPAFKLVKYFKPTIKSSLVERVIKLCLIVYLVVLILTQAYNIKFISNPFSFFSLSYPFDALNYLQSNPRYATGNIFNSYEWGGYLLWNYPNKKIFIDGRFPQVEFDGRTLLAEYLDFFAEPEKIEAKIIKYDIHLVLLSNKGENINLSKYLASHKNWKRIYVDPVSLLYYRSVILVKKPAL